MSINASRTSQDRSAIRFRGHELLGNAERRQFGERFDPKPLGEVLSDPLDGKANPGQVMCPAWQCRATSSLVVPAGRETGFPIRMQERVLEFLRGDR